MRRPRFLDLAEWYGVWWGYVGVCSTCGRIRIYRSNPRSRIRVVGTDATDEIWKGYGDDAEIGGTVEDVSQTYPLPAMCPGCGEVEVRIVKAVFVDEPESWWPWNWRDEQMHVVTAEDYFAMKAMDETMNKTGEST